MKTSVVGYKSTYKCKGLYREMKSENNSVFASIPGFKTWVPLLPYSLTPLLPLNFYFSLRICLLTAILLGLLTACGTVGLVQPSHLVIQQGLIKYNQVITLQLSQAQQQPSIQPQIPNFKINRLAITEQIPLTVQNLPTYCIRGNYSLTISLPSWRLTQPQNPFEIYLQRQKEGKTWHLLLPQSTDNSPVWLSYSI